MQCDTLYIVMSAHSESEREGEGKRKRKRMKNRMCVCFANTNTQKRKITKKMSIKMIEDQKKRTKANNMKSISLFIFHFVIFFIVGVVVSFNLIYITQKNQFESFQL